MSSPARSTRSSRASTPAGQDSPAFESPRSRLQKLLAPFDEDSDDEDTPVRPLARSITAPKVQLTDRTRTDDAFQKEKDGEEEDEDEAVFKPRGRLAARMAGVGLPIQEESSESSEDEDVYQRIRRDLMASKSTATQVQSPQPSPSRKRLLNRTHRESTPASVRSESPGLFMSPAPNSRRQNNEVDKNSSGSDSDLPEDPSAPSRLGELVKRRRAERLAKEQAERDAAEERAESGQAPLSDLFQDEDTRDETAERRLTQHARPTRKASKKALEEMNRETQRIKRNMQLTHQAKVKKRFTPQDFLSAFSRPKAASALANVTNAADMTSSSPPPENSSVAGPDRHRGTPPSSPPTPQHDSHKDAQEKPVDAPSGNVSDEELPTLEEIMTQPRPKIDKGKAPVREAVKKVRVTPRPQPTTADDSDDDLEIVHNRFAMFDEIPKMQAPAAKADLLLRHLAHLNQPEKTRLKKGQKPSMTPAQLEIQLRKRARELANRERAEKLAELRAKGIIIMTEEEREKEQLQIEDMLSRARDEADKLRKQEKAAAKANGEDVLASSDESEDEDYVGSGEEADIQAEEDEEDEMELSGSEDDDNNNMIDNEAGEDDQEEVEQAEDEVDEQADLEDISVPRVRRARRKHVIEDDEDEDDKPAQQKDAQNSNSGINDELAAAFGFSAGPAAPMGMSQMFAGTMADTQPSDYNSQDQDSLEMLRHIPSAPVPTLPNFEDSQDVVADSQVGASQTQQVNLHFTQPATDSPSVNRMSQFSEIPDPSQDVGFAPGGTPLGPRTAPTPSTADTVVPGVPESPVVQRKGRLMRRSEVGQLNEEAVPSSAPTPKPAPSNAFAMMRKAAQKPAQPDFDKKKSNARGMVEEQAEESEDEYAGLGGASDDEDAGSGDEDDKQMIDESDVHVDERKLAALYAEKARAENEAQTSKLYKDLMSGALRRKRGANAFELDSDEDDQMAERRRRRQREEARKRRLLLQDETIGKLGSNDKKEAFLRAIEDRDEMEDDADYLDGHEIDVDEPMQDSQPTASQQVQSQGQAEAPLDQVSGNALKRSADEETPSQEEQPRKKPSSLRRSTVFDTLRKPKSIAEVRESVSFLIDEPHANDSAGMILLSDTEPEDEAASAQEKRAPASDRRIPAKPDIIDRLTLKKQSSTIIDDSNETQAFASKSSFSFKPPTLLRKATTSTVSDSFSAPTLSREDSGVRKGGSKKSSINYQAREAERKVLVERAERKRQENVKKIAGLRRKAGGALGSVFGAGGFE